MKRFFVITGILISQIFYSQTPEEIQEIKYASEAAPNHITDNASFMMFKDGKYVEIKKGTNNFTCFVIRNPNGRYEPSCLNEEAMRSIFPTYEMHTQLLYNEVSDKNALTKIEEAFKEGIIPTAETGALVYMMSPNNKVYNHNTKSLIKMPAHQMYFYPKISDETFSLTGTSPWLWQGYPHLSSLIVLTDN